MFTTKHKSTIARTLLLTLAAISIQLSAQRSEDNPLAARENAQKREQLIQSIIRYKVDARLDLANADVQKELFAELEEAGLKLVPEKPVDVRSEKDILAEANKLVVSEFKKSPKAVEKETREKLEKELTPINIGDEVSVKYARGRNLYTLSGKFHGFADNNNKVRIGTTSLPLLDLEPEERLRFDAAKLKAYIDKTVYDATKKHESQMLETRSRALARIRKAIDDGNNNNGYVYSQSQWRSAKDVATDCMKDFKSDPLPVPAQRTDIDLSKPKTAAEIAKMKIAATKQIDDWEKQAANSKGADVLSGFQSTPWTASLDLIESYYGDNPGFGLRNDSVDFTMPKDDLSEGPSEISMMLYKDHLTGYSRTYVIQTVEDAANILKPLLERLGKQNSGELPLADKSVTVKWEGAKVIFEAIYTPPAEEKTGHLVLQATRKDAAKLIDQLPTAKR